MAGMDKQAQLRVAAKRALAVAPGITLAIGYAVVPLFFAIVMGVKGWGGATSGNPALSGIGPLLWESFWIPAFAAVLAILLALSINALALFSERFRETILIIIAFIFFSNPIFFVFVWAFLWPWARGPISVVSATTYILFPLTAVVIHSGFRSLSIPVIQVARLSGATAIVAFKDIILPWIMPEIILAWLLGYISALGFYLVPLYVGGARIKSASASLDRALNQVGDVETAGVFILIIIGLAVIGIMLAGTAYATIRTKFRGIR